MGKFLEGKVCLITGEVVEIGRVSAFITGHSLLVDGGMTARRSMPIVCHKSINGWE